MSITFSTLLAGGLCVGYIVLLVIATRRQAALGKLYSWIMALLIVALLAQAVHLLPESVQLGMVLQPNLTVLLAGVLLIALTVVTFKFSGARWTRLILIAGVVWEIATLATAFAAPTSVGQIGWFGRSFADPVDVTGLLAIVGGVVLGGLAVALAVRRYGRADLPEVANRYLLWGLIVALTLVGLVMGVSGSAYLRESGWLVQFVALLGLFYNALSHRIVDMRQLLRMTLNWGILALVTALVILITLFIERSLTLEGALLPLALAVIATFAAIVYIPIQRVVMNVVRRLLGKSSDDLAASVRTYSQRIAGVVELSDLAQVITDAIREVMNVRGGGILIATEEEMGTTRLEPMIISTTPRPPSLLRLHLDDQVYQRMFVERRPLMQYDLEYSREFAVGRSDIATFFKALRMSSYAPIVLQGQVVGVLAAGSKLNGDPVYPQDLELLATLANQTGAALRNARLVTDLRRASAEAQALNTNLFKTKERMEQLDSVKTDFVTIASHELRTPLAQIRGYTDILDAMNEQAMLDQDQVTGMVSNMRKATDRLEKLIADMLDVSQLGLDAMDLRFAQTTLDSVLRLAIEPLAESVKQRKLQLTARGLRNLPPIEADMQRLVQAFRNICVNAIKYTPDGGRIDINAHLEKDETTRQDQIVVEVADTGIGIDQRYQDLIFEKFFRVADPGLHSTGTTKFMGAGPGLGLTIARGVIEGHGGKIDVVSQGFDAEKLPGSTFVITLPIHPPKSARRVLPFEGAAQPLASNSTLGLGSGNGTSTQEMAQARVPQQGA
ncbi:MAG: GAF domain-containing protein [Anaerolineae bacterium]|nr:GAF domain-containing protein [Anaerolineae bacterium]